jgi:hypothetical protein
MGLEPRRAPRNVPDSLPERDSGTDIAPNEVRDTDRPRELPPDSLPSNEDNTRP